MDRKKLKSSSRERIGGEGMPKRCYYILSYIMNSERIIERPRRERGIEKRIKAITQNPEKKALPFKGPISIRIKNLKTGEELNFRDFQKQKEKNERRQKNT